MGKIKEPSRTAARDDRELTELERALNEGIDDLDAGRTVSREESRREIEEILAAYENKGTPKP